MQFATVIIEIHFNVGIIVPADDIGGGLQKTKLQTYTLINSIIPYYVSITSWQSINENFIDWVGI